MGSRNAPVAVLMQAAAVVVLSFPAPGFPGGRAHGWICSHAWPLTMVPHGVEGVAHAIALANVAYA